MAEQKRNLNIPIYAAGVSVETVDLGDAVIDAEVVGDRPGLGERVKAQATRHAEKVEGAFRNVRANGVKDTFITQPVDAAREAAGADDPRLHARREGRSRRSEQARVHAEQGAAGKQAQTERKKLQREAKVDPLAKLKLDTAEAGERYMESLRKSGILGADQTPATQRKQLRGMHQVYASMMVLQCVQPLQQGLSSQNVASVLGMGASMWMLSPNFRTQLGTLAGQMGDVIREKIEGRGTKKDLKAQEKFDKLASKGKGNQLAGRWQRRLDNIESAERGHRLPFTAQSAAMTEVALAETAYADMRHPGVDPSVVRDRYETSLAALYEYVDADGLSREDVSRSMRVIVGQRLEKEPAIANVFSELGHGRFTKSEPREVYINGTTDTATVWTGDFVDTRDGRTVSSGSFSLRIPMDLNEHRVQATRSLSAEMAGATSAGELNDVLSQYVVAASVGRYPDVVEQVEDPDARRRLGKARSMFGSMSDDGLSPDEQRFVYSGAYLDAIRIVQHMNPELGNQWAEQYGEQWREKVDESMRMYSDLGDEAERGQRFTAGSDGNVHDAQGPDDVGDNAEDIVDAEVVEDDLAPEAEPARDAIVDGLRSAAKKDGYDEGAKTRSASSRFRRARVNQHYNEVDTGGITGIGRDDAAPLQDVDFELG